MRWLIRFFITLLVLIPIIYHIVSRASFNLEETQNDTSFLTNLEHWSYDKRLDIMSPKSRDDEVVILDIDEKSLAKIGQWPWARNDIANVVDTLFEYYSIDVLGFDITFPEPDRSEDLELLDELELKFSSKSIEHDLNFEQLRTDRNRDDILAKSFKGRSVVLGFVLDDDTRTPAGVLPNSKLDSEDPDHDLAFYDLNTFTGNLDVLQENAYGAGNFNPIAYDSDGKIRRIPLLVSHKNKIYDSLSLAVVKAKLKADVKFKFTPGKEKIYDWLDGLDIGGFARVPVGEYTNMLIPYRGVEETFRYISVIDVLEKKVSKEILDSKIIIIGTRAAGLKDFRVTPVGENYPGVEIHANAISAMLLGNNLEIPFGVTEGQLILLMILSILITVIMIKFPIVLSSIIIFLSMLSIWLINLKLWGEGFVVPLMPIIVFMLLSFLAHLIYGSFIESRNKQQLTRLFGQYVPPTLVNEMEADLNSYTMETKQADLTVMFADIKGFTTLSETLNADQVAELLNEFLTTMTKVIHDKRGTIDKYMGDAIMAFWGAPLDDEQHAQHAVETAFLMQEKMQELNIKLTERNLPNIDICVGVNTGNMSVGNMGSEFRMAYTVIGDSVNLASRLESLTRIYGVGVMLGENTRRILKSVLCLELDKVIVKGKEETVTVYEPIGFTTDMTQEQATMLEKQSQALMDYRNRNWTAANSLFKELKEEFPDKRVFQLFLQRIENLIENPPGENWNGAFKFTEK